MANGRDFSGKVALITGSSSGIGAQTAITLSKLGALVVITGRDCDNISKIAIQCENVSPKHLKPLEIVADLTVDDDCKRLVETTIERFGKLDILVNNAGAGTLTQFSDHNFINAFDSIIKLNLRSVVFITQLSVQYLELTKGVIINMSSVLAQKPVIYLLIY
jgi:NAD(P)-dependent dehydrogenase (short-subunit alcohol dehydrogenase family)